MARFNLDDTDSSEEEEDHDMREPRTTQETAEDIDEMLLEDGDIGMDDAAVVSDVEMEKESEAILRNAQASYLEIFDAVKTDTEKMMEENETEDQKEEEDDDEDAYFDDENLEVALPPAPRRIKISREIYEMAANTSSRDGICGRISNKAFASDRRVPSNIDYGRRMGRSFRVGWSPDGSFLKLTPCGTMLKRCRPVFAEESPDQLGEKYLENHLKHSLKLATEVDDGSPRFVLPVSIGNDGDVSTHASLHQALTGYSGKGKEIGNQAFSLLACLVDDNASVSQNEPAIANLKKSVQEDQFAVRRKEGVTRFFELACRQSMESDIDTASRRNDSSAAILSALSGGNLTRACDLASSMGAEGLAAVLASYDSEGIQDISEQVKQISSGSSSSFPREQIQVLKILSGDINAVRNVDWKRRFLMKLMYDNLQTLPDVLEAYEKDVQDAVAPYPSPPYRTHRPGVQSILYRLLLSETSPGLGCLHVVDPAGVSSFHHDFVLAFHLAASLVAAGLCPPISLDDEERLIDGYVTQLVSAGLWEWGVQVCLCCLNPAAADTASSTVWKKMKAKSLVLKHLNINDPQCATKRRFLEKIGVPKEWFSEALAIRYASNGDPFQYIRYLASYSPSEAAVVVDDVIVPNMLFMSERDKEQSVRLMEAFQGELSPLGQALLNMIELSNELHALAKMPREAIEERLPVVQEVCKNIENTFVSQKAKIEKMKGESILRYRPAFVTVPMSSMLSEVLDHCLFLRLQIKALEIGVEFDSTMSRQALTTQLAFQAVDEYSEQFSKPSVLRGLR